MDSLIDIQKGKYLEIGFEVAKRLAHAGYNLEKPAYTITWGQIAEELSHILVDQDIEFEMVTNEVLVELVQGVKDSLGKEFVLQWREFARTQLTTQDGDFQENPEPDQESDEGVLVEQFENATRLGDEEGYWVDGGASANLFDDC